METVLARIQRRLAFVCVLSLALTPVIGYCVAALFGMIDLETLFFSATGLALMLAYGLLITWASVYFYAFLKPLRKWHANQAYGHPLPEALVQRLHAFTSSYWSFYLIYVLMLPTLQYWAGLQTANGALVESFLNFLLLQLVIAVLVGMPGYLLALTKLGSLNQYLGAPIIAVSMRTKLLLIGAYLPILTTVAYMKYYWWRTGYLNNEILIASSLFAFLSILVTALSIRSLQQALAPVHQVINSSGASTNQQLAEKLRPHSLDEIGYLIQMLGRLFKRLADQESHVSAIVDHAGEGIIVLDEQQNIDIFNPAAEWIFGYRAQEIRGKPLRWLIPTLDAKECTRSEDMQHEMYARHANGASIPLSLRLSAMQREDQTFYTLLVSDITERKSAERLLLEAEARYRMLVETAHDLVWSVNCRGEWTYLNNATHAIYGYAPEEMLHRHFNQYQAPESADRDAAAFARLLEGHELLQYETVHLDKQGRQRHLSFNAKPIMDDDGEIIAISGTARDITDQKQFERELTYQAQHDTLTGLYNRQYFQRELERVISRIARSAGECVLLYLDLDQFKYVNDTLGHAAGDRLLIDCTELLANHVREGDLVARFGGDEFTVLLYNLDRQHANTVLENIRKVFERYRFMDSGKTFNVTCSIGATIIDSQTESAETALVQADLACNIAKSQGRNRIHLYNAGDSEQSAMAEDIGWVARVCDAIDNDKFELFYQPIVNINNNIIHGYEVLLRLPTNDGKAIMPGGFIPAAERFGLVQNIDRWTVTRSMHYLSELHGAQVATRFAINLSGRAFEDRELLDIIQGILRDSQLNPAALTFEVTETAAIANLQAARKFIGKLKDLGCTLALDDFGTGFCSFTYLKHLPVDILKIDGSFVQNVAGSKVDQAMVQSMNQIAHALGKSTIAEFVEDQKTLTLLHDMGVDFAQGHFIGKPRRDLLVELERHSQLA